MNVTLVKFILLFSCLTLIFNRVLFNLYWVDFIFVIPFGFFVKALRHEIGLFLKERTRKCFNCFMLIILSIVIDTYTIWLVCCVCIIFVGSLFFKKIKNDKYNACMQWEIIVSAKISATKNNSNKQDLVLHKTRWEQIYKNYTLYTTPTANNWEMVYTSINGTTFIQKGNKWLVPAINHDEKQINAICYKNSIYFVIWTRSVWENIASNLDQEHFKYYLVEYDFELTNEINRIELKPSMCKNMHMDKDFFSLSLVLSGSTKKKEKGPAIIVFGWQDTWILNLNVKKKELLLVKPLILQVLKKNFDGYLILKTLTMQILNLSFYVWQGCLIANFRFLSTQLYGLVVFHNGELKIIEFICAFNVINKNLAFFGTNDSVFWAVTSCKKLLNHLKKPKNPEEPQKQLQWTKLQKEPISDFYSWDELFEIWKKTINKNKTQDCLMEYENNKKTDNTASKLFQYSRGQRVARMNQIINHCGLFLPKDILFFLTEF
jgi:hypothetical protein